ncbi:MAG: LuxR C-terminal-related transcriptional regulator [Mycobacteriales bacterium]
MAIAGDLTPDEPGVQHVMQPQVLVVDRSQLFADAVARSLTRSGLPARAIRPDELAAAPCSPVVLLDGDGPQRSTIALAAAVRSAAPDAQLVLILKATHRDPERAARAVGARGWVHRQSGFDDVAWAVRRVLNGRPLFRPRHAASVPVAAPDLACLTTREIEVLTLIASGRQNEGIAADLGISTHTVRTHVQSILSKLGVANRVAAVTLAHQTGLLARNAAL